MKLIKAIAKLFYNLITITIIVLIIIAAYCIIQTRIMHRDYADVLGYTFFEIKTGSMSGTIEINDIIIVKLTNDVHVDDIISFYSKTDVITHRVINDEGDLLLTQGDANNKEDPPVDRNLVIGKVVKILPGFGIWLKVLSSWKVIACIMITLTLLGMAISTEKKTRSKRHSFSKGIRKLFESLKNREDKE